MLALVSENAETRAVLYADRFDAYETRANLCADSFYAYEKSEYDGQYDAIYIYTSRGNASIALCHMMLCYIALCDIADMA